MILEKKTQRAFTALEMVPCRASCQPSSWGGDLKGGSKVSKLMSFESWMDLMMLTLVDVGQDTTLRNGDVSEKLVQLLVVADGELEMTGDDTGLLVVTRGVAGQLEDLGGQVLKDGCKVDGRA